jgi:hypothetical protein
MTWCKKHIHLLNLPGASGIHCAVAVDLVAFSKFIISRESDTVLRNLYHTQTAGFLTVPGS